MKRDACTRYTTAARTSPSAEFAAAAAEFGLDCLRYRCTTPLTVIRGAAVIGVVEMLGPDGVWRRCDTPGQTFSVPGSAGTIVCPTDQSLCVQSCLPGNCSVAAVVAVDHESNAEVRMQLRADYTLSGFNATVQLGFRRALAALACFSPNGGGGCLNVSQVSLSAELDPASGGRRASVGLLINVTLSGVPSEAAAALAGNLTADRINAALRAQGLGPVTVTRAAEVIAAVSPAMAPAPRGSVIGMAGAAPPPTTISAAGSPGTHVQSSNSDSRGPGIAANVLITASVSFVFAVQITLVC